MKRTFSLRKNLLRTGVIVAGFMMISLSLPGAATPDYMDDIMRISLKFFPKFLAVDLDLKEKVYTNEKLPILIFYKTDKTYASGIAAKMAAKNRSIAGFKTDIFAANKLPEKVPAAVIIVEKLDNLSLAEVIDYCRRNKLLLFSPFEEDVKRGVTVSISIGARIRPYFNGKALEESAVRIHPILLKSSVVFSGG